METKLSVKQSNKNDVQITKHKKTTPAAATTTRENCWCKIGLCMAIKTAYTPRNKIQN